MKPAYDFIASPNRRASRSKAISAIVLHYTGSMNIEGTIAWFKSPASAVSAHYVIGRDGRVVQMVDDAHVAWHAGRSAMFPKEKPPREPNVNDFSLGIELVGDADSGFTDRQLASLYELLARLVQKYRVPPTRVVGHAAIAPGRKIDPDGYELARGGSQFPWAKALAVCAAAYTPASTIATPRLVVTKEKSV